MSRLKKKLIKMNACYEAREWASGQTGSFQESWDQCLRGDWMLWFLTKSKSNEKNIVLASCQIARTVLKYVPKGEERPLRAIMAAESWVRGEVDLKEVKKAYAGADAAGVGISGISGASFAAFAFAAFAAASVSDAAGNAAAAVASAYWDEYTAGNAGNAGNATSAYAATEEREASYLNSANIIRKLFPKYPK